MLDFVSGAASRSREPIFSIPAVIVVLVGALVAIHAIVSIAGGETRDMIYIEGGFIPGRFTISVWPERLAELLARSNYSADALNQARLWRETTAGHSGLKPWTLVTYALLHVTWTHVAMNSIWIVAFGPPVARRFGAVRFVLFFVATAVAGALAHWTVAPMEFAPLIGASAADSGLMAAAARFIFQPGASLGGPRGGGVPSAPTRTATLRELFTDRRALVFIGIWMATNFVFGAGAQSLGASEGPVAWVAHVGGFVAGLVLFPLFDRPARES